MTTITIDFESFYSSREGFTLSKMTTEEYIRSPLFETIGVGVGAEGSYFWLSAEEFAAFALGLDWKNITVRCHHAHFDGLILAVHFGIHPGKFECTLSMGRALHGVEVGNSLAKLSEFYGVGKKGDEVVKADGKRRRDFTPDEWATYGRYCMLDCQLCDGIFDKMTASGFPPSELPIIDLTVKMFTNPHLVLDRERATAFVGTEKSNKAALMAKAGIAVGDRAALLSNENMALLLQAAGVDLPMKWSEKKKRMDWAFAKSDPEFAALKDHDEVGDLVKARLGVKSTINETRAERMLKMDARGGDTLVKVPRAGKGTLTIYIRTSGAHTHRWTGAERMNWQNLTKGPKGMRMLLRAPPGYKLVVADASQIEARDTAWVAGQDDLIEVFRRGEDPYCKLATKSDGRPVTKSEEDKPFRAVGKLCQLGLGFSMGWTTLARGTIAGPAVNNNVPIIFTEQDAGAMGVNLDAFLRSDKLTRLDEIPSMLSKEKLAIHSAVCDHLVNVYRKENKEIVKFWYEVCPLLLKAMLDGDEEQCGPVRTEKDALVLPNGLKLRYPQLQAHDENGRTSYTYWKSHSARSGFHSRLYGGLLTENIIQSTSRVILTDQLGALYEGGYLGPGSAWHVVTTTHDEIVLCVPDSEAEYALEVLLTVMKIAPPWAEGLPLGAEGGLGDCYGEISK